MAKKWFTTLPDKYFMRQSPKGGRHEILFTVLGLGFLHVFGFNSLRASYWRRTVQSNDQWARVQVNNAPYSSKV